ncbi:stage II sporulation protein E [Hazenella sp. IB182357]|uniref:Stage II sporulation protein E n=1 Tax=Polycladospora coralii TaxID=2771432 RepID=A0A926RXE8_9BACL|nr:stage II sporulation protein E [Polycladospora coralii]MBD1372451.1 stage II sporulation protein E [Polycladospora coralii]MBS7531773.1 stage II sporulation protein E [Polycladospora coralii]
MKKGIHLKKILVFPQWKQIGVGSGRQQRLLYFFSKMWNLPLILMGVLLGRAMILDQVAPFALAYLAVVYHISRKQWPVVMVSLIIGAVTIQPDLTVKIICSLFLYVVIQKIGEWMGKGQMNYAPFMVALTSLLIHIPIFWFKAFTSYQVLIAGIDILLSFILTFIFVNALPLFTMKKKRFLLRHEEMVCLVILVGSVMTGLIGLTIADISLVHLFSRYFILVVALIGGGMLGSSMGVVMGLVLSLSNPASLLQLSLLAFAGLLGGLFKEGGKIGVAIGFMMGSAILTLYDQGSTMMWMSLQESLIAVVLFLLTPQKIYAWLARYIPGTSENQDMNQDYVKRLRDVTATKVDQFRELFHELAISFREDEGKQRKEDEDHLNHFITEVMNEACVGCRRAETCWNQNVMTTYHGMMDLMARLENEPPHQRLPVPRAWSQICVRGESVMDVIRAQYGEYEKDDFWKSKMRESQRLVSEQLAGMSEIMSELASDIRREVEVLGGQEEQIHDALEELGLSIQRVDIINLEEGKVEVEVMIPHRDGLDECKKLVAPLLTEILGEPIAVYRKVINDRTEAALITLGSAQRFELKTGAATAAKGGAYVSGDSYCYMNVGTGKYAVALSDGMGNGPRAQRESSSALKLMKKLLQSGMREERAVDTINSILSLRSSDEVFATIDLAMVDLNTAEGRFMKIGSTPGFIKRGKSVIPLAASNPPIGILKDIDIDSVEMKLEPGDLIIMMTDGVYDAPRHILNKDAFMEKIIKEIVTKDPQSFADCLLERVIRQHHGQIKDDMTIVVSKVERYVPEWSTIRLPGLQRIDRSPAVV